VDADLTAAFARDWTGRWQGEPVAVVRPGNSAAVAAVVSACGRHGVPLVPQGGNTGLVGAGVPRDGEVVLSTRRLDAPATVDAAARTVVAGAGVTLARVQAAARGAGLDVGIDFGARDSATVGGIAATNAGGERVMRHGTTRSQVLGVEAVLADGSVVRRLSGLPKDNSGYDLTQLLVGSEGTLGVITAVMLRLVPLARRRCAALLAVDGVGAAVAALVHLRERLPELDAAEFFTEAGLRLVLSRTGAAHPFDAGHPLYLLVEVAGGHEPGRAGDLTDLLTGVLGGLDGLRDAVVAESGADRRRLWDLREGHTEAVGAAGVPVKLDVAVPLDRLEAFVAALPGVVAAVAPSAVPVLFGHLAEGNVHVNVLHATRADADGAVTDAVLRLVAGNGGSISAEHGIGRAKRRWLGLTRDAADVAAMRAVKSALDPAGLLSPGRVLPD
jgi:FAD/FMN-containing dehydrogenase